MADLFKLILGILASRFKARATLEAENLVLRQQLNVLRRRTPKRPHLNNTDRFLFVWLYRGFPSVLEMVAIVRPETIIRWHRCHCRKLSPALKCRRIGRCSWLMRDVCSLIWLALIGLFRSRASLQAEILTLRHQLNGLRPKSPQRRTFTSIDRLGFSGLYRLAPGVLDALKIVRPETVIRWHRAGFRAYWRWKSRPRSGRPKTRLEIRQLIREISLANPLWGAPRIHGELLKLGIDVGQTHCCKVYGEGKATTVPRVEDVPS